MLLSITMEVVDDLPKILKKDTANFYMSSHYRKTLPIKLIELRDLMRNEQVHSKLLNKQLRFLSIFFKSIRSFDSLDDFCTNPVLKVWSEKLISRLCDFSLLSEESKNMIILCVIDNLRDILCSNAN